MQVCTFSTESRSVRFEAQDTWDIQHSAVAGLGSGGPAERGSTAHAAARRTNDVKATSGPAIISTAAHGFCPHELWLGFLRSCVSGNSLSTGVYSLCPSAQSTVARL